MIKEALKLAETLNDTNIITDYILELTTALHDLLIVVVDKEVSEIDPDELEEAVQQGMKVLISLQHMIERMDKKYGRGA